MNEGEGGYGRVLPVWLRSGEATELVLELNCKGSVGVDVPPSSASQVVVARACACTDLRDGVDGQQFCRSCRQQDAVPSCAFSFLL